MNYVTTMEFIRKEIQGRIYIYIYIYIFLILNYNSEIVQFLLLKDLSILPITQVVMLLF
jgi:hypothetical protein